MREKTLASVLNREQATSHAEEHFADQISLLRDLTDYGSNLLFRAFNSSPKDLPAVVVKQMMGSSLA
jgi:hypothetical protein